MQVIPVIDLLGGQVVRGLGGRRSEYRPIESKIAADARPATVARAFVEQFGFETAYVADLDAIMHGKMDVKSWQEIAAAGLELWLDAGTTSVVQVEEMKELVRQQYIPARLIVGLESLASESELAGIVDLLGLESPIFSLDLKDGRPITRIPSWHDLDPAAIAQAAVKMGIWDLIVLDLADVGASGGTRTLELCHLLWKQQQMRIIAGGGVRSTHDLQMMADAGCQNALVASALHDGRITAHDIDNARDIKRVYSGPA